MAFKDIVDNYRLRGFKDIFRPKKWGMYLRSLKDKYVGFRINQKDVIEFSEVVIYRSQQCTPCVNAGKCVVCGCPSPDLFLDLDNECADGKWKSLDPDNWVEEWKQFKEGEGMVITPWHP